MPVIASRIKITKERSKIRLPELKPPAKNGKKPFFRYYFAEVLLLQNWGLNNPLPG